MYVQCIVAIPEVDRHNIGRSAVAEGDPADFCLSQNVQDLPSVGYLFLASSHAYVTRSCFQLNLLPEFVGLLFWG